MQPRHVRPLQSGLAARRLPPWPAAVSRERDALRRVEEPAGALHAALGIPCATWQTSGGWSPRATGHACGTPVAAALRRPPRS